MPFRKLYRSATAKWWVRIFIGDLSLFEKGLKRFVQFQGQSEAFLTQFPNQPHVNLEINDEILGRKLREWHDDPTQYENVKKYIYAIEVLAQGPDESISNLNSNIVRELAWFLKQIMPPSYAQGDFIDQVNLLIENKKINLPPLNTKGICSPLTLKWGIEKLHGEKETAFNKYFKLADNYVSQTINEDDEAKLLKFLGEIQAISQIPKGHYLRHHNLVLKNAYWIASENVNYLQKTLKKMIKYGLYYIDALNHTVGIFREDNKKFLFFYNSNNITGEFIISEIDEKFIQTLKSSFSPEPFVFCLKTYCEYTKPSQDFYLAYEQIKIARDSKCQNFKALSYWIEKYEQGDISQVTFLLYARDNLYSDREKFDKQVMRFLNEQSFYKEDYFLGKLSNAWPQSQKEFILIEMLQQGNWLPFKKKEIRDLINQFNKADYYGALSILIKNGFYRIMDLILSHPSSHHFTRKEISELFQAAVAFQQHPIIICLKKSSYWESISSQEKQELFAQSFVNKDIETAYALLEGEDNQGGNRIALLQLAASHGDSRIFKQLLLSCYPAPNLVLPDDEILKDLLMSAISSRKNKIAIFLLKYIMYAAETLTNILPDAIQNGNVTIFEMLHKKGAILSKDFLFEDVTQKTTHLAARYGKVEILKYINVHVLFVSQNDTPLTIRASNGLAPLHFAARYNQLNVIKYLSQKKIDLSVLDSKKRSILYYAAKTNSRQIFELFSELIQEHLPLIDSLSFYKPVAEWPLHTAIKTGHSDLVQYLLEQPEYSSLSLEEYEKCFELAAQYKEKLIFNSLQEQWITQGNILDYLVTHLALVLPPALIVRCPYDISKVILNPFTAEKLNEQDKDGFTLLHYAYREGENQLIEYLLKKGAKPNITNFRGKTPKELQKRQDAFLIEELVVEQFVSDENIGEKTSSMTSTYQSIYLTLQINEENQPNEELSNIILNPEIFDSPISQPKIDKKIVFSEGEMEMEQNAAKEDSTKGLNKRSSTP